jgi:hypothetical protein
MRLMISLILSTWEFLWKVESGSDPEVGFRLGFELDLEVVGGWSVPMNEVSVSWWVSIKDAFWHNSSLVTTDIVSPSE